jgi:hypothetical protein
VHGYYEQVLKLSLVRTASQTVFWSKLAEQALSVAGQAFQSALATMVSATMFRSVLEGLAVADYESCVEALEPTQAAMVLLGALPMLVTLIVTDPYWCVEV